MNDEKANAANINKKFKRLGLIKDQHHEVDLAKSEIERKEPIIVGFFLLQDAKLRALELHYDFFLVHKKNFDAELYEEMEMNTNSLYLALSEKEL